VKRRQPPVYDATIPKLKLIAEPCRWFTGLPPHRDPDLRLRIMEDVMAARLGLPPREERANG
jgi:hypothetical protein